MPKPFRLQTVLDLAAREAEKSAVRLGTLNAQLQQVEAKLNLLLQYREDYLERLRVGIHQDPHSAGWRNFHDFMDKLEAAITQQLAIVNHAHELMRKGQTEYCDHQRRVKAFDVLAGRQRDVETLRAGQAEQRAADEITAETVRRRTHRA